MGYYMQANVKGKYLCAWKCVSCHEMSVENGCKDASARIRYGLIGTHKDEAGRLAEEAAKEKLENTLDKLAVQVNLKRSYRALNVQGICRKCGKKQPWRRLMWLKLLLCLAYIVIIFVLTGRTAPAEWQIPCIVLGVIAIWYGTSWMIDLLAHRKLRQMEDGACYPLVICGKIPDDVDKDDPRLQAIIAKLAPQSVIQATQK